MAFSARIHATRARGEKRSRVIPGPYLSPLVSANSPINTYREALSMIIAISGTAAMPSIMTLYQRIHLIERVN